MTRSITKRAATLAALLTTTGVAIAVVAHTGHAQPSVTQHALRLTADNTGSTVYPSEGVTLSAPTLPVPPAATAAGSSDSVMQSLRAQEPARGLLGASIDSTTYTVEQKSVTETMPTAVNVTAGVPYDGWVVTFTGVTPVSYSGHPLPSGLSCRFVGIMSIATGTWTEFFVTCT